MKRVYGLDLVRFVTAMCILSYHYFFIGPIQGFYSMNVFHPICFLGEFGVDVFFVISGFVILFSTEKNKSVLTFLKKRAKRIYPTFIVCSIITLLCGFLMPGTSKFNLVFRWLNSFTFYSDLYNVSPLSSVYWTLMIEVKFYILVAIILKLKVWEKHKFKVLMGWLLIAIFNNYELHNQYIEMLFITKYAGHFILGILLYYNYKKIFEKKFLLLGALSIWLIYLNMTGFLTWIRSIYSELQYSTMDVLFIMLALVFMLYVAINEFSSRLSPKVLSTMGAISFVFYLVHADFGYFIRTQYYLHFSRYYLVNEHVIMVAEIICSLVLAYIILKFVDFFQNRIKIKISFKNYE